MRKYLTLVIVMIIAIGMFFGRSNVCNLLRNVHSIQIERICGSRYSTLEYYKRDPATTNPIHPLLFTDQEAFTKAINGTHSFTSEQLRGGIIPHHLVASDNIANFFLTMKQSNNATIIFVGPNHYEKGDFDVLTSRLGWDSPYGVVEPNTAIIDELITKNLAHIDEDAVEHDHSVASFAPFIQYFIPRTKIVPIILKRGFSLKDIEALSDYLASLENKCHPGESGARANDRIPLQINNPCNIFFLASVDFSHYLPKEIAFQKDELTEKLLMNKNYEELYRLNNDYLDNPPSIIVLIKTMEKLKVNNMQIFAHTNSANYSNSDQKNTTSHFVVGFW